LTSPGEIAHESRGREEGVLSSIGDVGLYLQTIDQ